MEPLFLEGTMLDKIWGGTKLRDDFGYDIPTDTTGELWAISAHPNGVSTVKNGEHAGKTLNELWDNNRKLFGYQEGDVFPLLTKIIDAQENLSVQVHPNDEYGLEFEGELGKTECWYILATEPDAEIVLGHNAKSKEEFLQLIEEEKWDDLLRKVKVKTGDFFYVPSGTVHAIGSGVMVLETQQSSDTTYRLYDYDRKDDEGNFRKLHINQSIDVITIPHNDNQPMPVKEKKKRTVKTLVSNKFFSVYEWDIIREVDFEQVGFYTLVSVINGEGVIQVGNNSYKIKKGDHFILPNGVSKWKINGNLQIIASNP